MARVAFAIVLLSACHKSAHEANDMADMTAFVDGPVDDAALPPAMDATVEPDQGEPAPHYDWVGVIGTGQSLSVGATAKYMTTTQPFHNLKLVDNGPANQYPIAPDMGMPQWATTPLTEPIRNNGQVKGTGTGYVGGGQYPENLYGETPHSGMANALTKLWSDRGNPGEYVSAHTVVGWSGHCLVDIDKEGDNGVEQRAYPASIEETRVWKALATAQGKTYGVGGIVLTHGECDAANASYGTMLYQFWQDYDADIKAITGQTRDPVLFASQQSTYGGEDSSAIQMWKQSLAHPGQIVCTGPKYQYGYNSGGLHLPAPGYLELGEKYAEVFDRVVNQGAAWKPLQPNNLTRSGTIVTLDFDVPYPPLVFDAHIPLPHQTANTEWKNGKGFEAKNGSTNLTVNSVAIKGSSVVITLSADPGASAKVTIDYAITQDGAAGTTNGGTADGLVGALRDSDAFVGWDEETLATTVTNGSASITTTTANGFLHRASKDIVTGTGIAEGTIVQSLDDPNAPVTLTLSNPWSGASGTVMLTFHHDEFNYCVHFTMTES